MAGLRHEQGRRDAVLAQMGQRTVAELVQCPLPSRCSTEQRPRPLVGEPPPAIRASIQLGRNEVGPTRGHKERTAAATGQVTGEEPCRRRAPHDDLRRSLKAAHLGKSLLSMTAAVNMPAFTVTMPAAMIQSCR